MTCAEILAQLLSRAEWYTSCIELAYDQDGGLLRGYAQIAVEREESDVRRVRTVRLKPGDVVVVEIPGKRSADAVARIREDLHRTWPQHEIVVLEGGATLRTVERA